LSLALSSHTTQPITVFFLGSASCISRALRGYIDHHAAYSKTLPTFPRLRCAVILPSESSKAELVKCVADQQLPETSDSEMILRQWGINDISVPTAFPLSTQHGYILSHSRSDDPMTHLFLITTPYQDDSMYLPIILPVDQALPLMTTLTDFLSLPKP
jgi:hypothetical protein